MNKWIAYLLISIPLSLALFKIIEFKQEVLLWCYVGIMLISTLITKWFKYSDKKNKFIEMSEHLTMVLGTTMFMWYFIYWILKG